MSVKSIERFSSRVEDYMKFKPVYPKKLIDFLYGECGFSRESVIADIGSRTGCLSRLLLERGSRVVGIEPDNDMRLTAERILCDEFSRFVSLNATAENTTLSHSSVNHIVCDQSFRGLDFKKCKEEFTRVLKPQGSIVLIFNRQIAGDDFSSEYEALIKRFSKNNETAVCSKSADEYCAEFFGNSRYSVLSIQNQQPLDFEGVKGRLLSSSDIPAEGEDGYKYMMEELEILFELYNQAGKVILKYEIETYAGNLNLAG